MSARAFGKYEVLARLATGGAASIFLARQPGAAGFKKLVCLKTLLAERAVDDDFVAMFLDEARLAARLNHPNCVLIYDLGRVRGVYYISMEYIFGETLWNLLTTVTKLKTPLPPAHVAGIIASVCDGLHHAHELKDQHGRPYHLVHRDVSPQNVMISFEGQTKVVDFGIAKAETGRASTVAGIVKGKFSYMSPEQITGSTVDRRSDIFSLGIVMFECLASRRLYRGDTPEEIAKLILEHRAPRLKDVVPDIPPALDEICAMALSRHVSKRFQSAAAMGDAIRAYLDDVRHNTSASNLAKLMQDRFGSIIDERRNVHEAALLPDYDEAALLKVLDARPVRELDLFPETQSPAPDFHEETVDDQKARKLKAHPLGDSDPEASAVTGEVAEENSGEHHHRGAGFRVQLTRAPEGNFDPLSVRTDYPPPAERAVEGKTNEAGPEGKTQFDPAPKAAEGGRRTPPRPMSSAASTMTEAPAASDEAPAWNDATHETQSYQENTPFEAVNGAVPERPVSDADAPTPNDGSAPDHLRPSDLEEIPENTSPPVPAPILEPPSDSGRSQDLVHPVAVTPQPPFIEVTEAPRYTATALAAALGFGISIGLVLGLLLARLIFY